MHRKILRLFKRLAKVSWFALLALLLYIIISMSEVPPASFNMSNEPLEITRKEEHLLVEDRSHKSSYLSNDLSLKDQADLRKIMKDANDEVYFNFKLWKNYRKEYCDGKITINGRTLIRTKDISLNRDLIHADADKLAFNSTFRQDDASEYYKFDYGAFRISCSRVLPYLTNIYRPDMVAHFGEWYRSIVSYSKWFNWSSKGTELDENVYAVVRYEYANVYWVIGDMYNVFLHCIFNGHNPSEVTVLLLEAHLKSPLDDLWKVVFGKVIRPNDLPRITYFKDLTWTISRSYSPYSNGDPFYNLIPFLGPFRKFILKRFYLYDNLAPGGCMSLRVTFVWRHNYVAHPRNPKGIVSRKFANEEELLNVTRTTFPHWKVEGHQLDALSINKQMEILSQTDVLVGMHGAALAYSFLIQNGGGVIELFPKGSKFNFHMRTIAASSGLIYKYWVNDDDKLENILQKTTRVPPSVVTDLLTDVSEKVCKKRKKKRLKPFGKDGPKVKPKRPKNKRPKIDTKVIREI